MKRRVGPTVVLTEIDHLKDALTKWQQSDKGRVNNMTLDEAIVASLGVLYRYYDEDEQAPHIDYNVYRNVER